MKDTAFKIDMRKVLDILSKDIYDSPLALLRENVQNAYDAILMRKHKDASFNAGCIRVILKDRKIIIKDNGIGMSYENLSENYWSTGCSGKNNDEARLAGVIGTFGIGAMANFGVCTELEVTSRKCGENTQIIYSHVKKEDISITEDCVKFEELQSADLEDFGTIVQGTLAPEHNITEIAAINYLKPYVRYIQVPIYVNDTLISKEKYWTVDELSKREVDVHGDFQDKRFSFHYHIVISRNNNQKVCPQILINNVAELGNSISGELWFHSEAPQLYGYRNSFGLAPIPADSSFHFGGVANLVNLTPTAGRDAVSRESIQFVTRILEMASKLVAEALSNSNLADDSREFQMYVRNSGYISLAGRITIGVPGAPNKYELRDVAPEMEGKGVMYYLGNDKTLMENFSDKNNILLLPSSDALRRHIQIQWLKTHNIQPAPDDVITMDEVEKPSDMSMSEFALKFKIERILEDDYLMPNAKVIYATISHGLSVWVKFENSVLKIYLQRGNGKGYDHLLTANEKDYSMFEPLTKEYVRTVLYPKFAEYLPSSKKLGAEALYKVLQQKKELYTIESEEQGNMDVVIGDYLKGKATMSDVMKAAQKARSSQRQVVTSTNVGSVAEIVGNIADRIPPIPQTSKQEESQYDALPPIVVDKDTQYKILRVDQATQSLQGYHSFLAVSDKMYNENKDFFMAPHTTKIIWSTHKIIYIFTHISGSITLYYDIDLNEPLSESATGGKAIQTCTIITNNRVFIPIIGEMNQYFDVTQRQLKFYVRFDTIRNA